MMFPKDTRPVVNPAADCVRPLTHGIGFMSGPSLLEGAVTVITVP